MIRVRRAHESDIDAMSEVLIASITRLCTPDHGGDPQEIAAWTANKTPDGVRAMLAAPANRLFVAEVAGQVVAVGCVRGVDEIALNYVHPNHRFQGVSRALLVAMETAMRELGTTTGRLESTATAHAFYLANGWRDAAGTNAGGRPDVRSMYKVL